MNMQAFLRSLGVVLVPVLVVLFVAGQLVDDYQLSLLLLGLSLSSLGIAWNILVSAGQISLGHVAFFGFPSYCAAVLMTRYGLSLVAAIAISFLLMVVAVAVIWRATARLRGVYFALVTLAVAELLLIASNALTDITGGAAGVAFSLPIFGVEEHFVAALAVLGLALTTHLAIRHSWVHFAFHTIRLYPESASAIGINVPIYKGLALLTSALLSGVAGLVYSSYVGYLSPHSSFSIDTSLDAQIVSLLGGLYIVTGPLVGGLLLSAGSEQLRNWFGEAHLFAYGIALIVLTLAWPYGILGAFQRVWGRMRGRAVHRRPDPNGGTGPARHTGVPGTEVGPTVDSGRRPRTGGDGG